MRMRFRLRSAYRSALQALMLAWMAEGAPAMSAQGLDSLPDYHPAQQVTGVIRNFGSPFGKLLAAWETGFAKFQPGVRFADNLQGHDAAIAGMISGVADLGTSGREPVLTELEMFYDAFGNEPVQIAVATGTYDVMATWCPVILVNKDNPLAGLTLKQLDGIFGAARTGGYHGFKWSPRAARTAQDDIRTWGQLGLTDEYANKPIQTYGYGFTGMTNYFQQRVFGGGDKWNPNYREYAETKTKMIAEKEGGEVLSIDHMLGELSQDRYGIAWTGKVQANRFPNVRVIPLAARQGDAFVMPSRETIQSRDYPLTRSIFIFMARPKPAEAVEPKLKEFLRYILSRQGQQAVVETAVYLPMTATVAREELQKLE